MIFKKKKNSQEEEVKVKAKTQRQEDKVGERKKESENSVDTEDPLSVLTDILAQVGYYTIKLYSYARPKVDVWNIINAFGFVAVI